MLPKDPFLVNTINLGTIYVVLVHRFFIKVHFLKKSAQKYNHRHIYGPLKNGVAKKQHNFYGSVKQLFPRNLIYFIVNMSLINNTACWYNLAKSNPP